MSDGGPVSSPLRIDRLRRPVADLARAVGFYRDGLGFALMDEAPECVRLRLGAQTIELVQHTGGAPLPPAAVAPDPRFQHAAIVAADIEAAWRRAESHGAIPISQGGPQTLPSNTGGVTAWKFRDLDGHPLELIRFPAGVGDARWQPVAPDGPATLGIDHFALVVRSVHRSVAFLTSKFGWTVGQRGVNRGAAQDRLDGLDGVEVDVVTLVPPDGRPTPHVELLRYRTPALPHGPADAPAQADLPDPGAIGRDEIVCRDASDGRPTATLRRVVDPDGHVFRRPESA